MCSFTPSPIISPETAAAFDDLRIAAAKYMGWDPEQTEMAICRPTANETGPWCGACSGTEFSDDPAETCLS